MIGLQRHELTVDRLREDYAEAAGFIEDDRTMAAVHARLVAMEAALEALPDGFRIERLQGSQRTGRDPGCELTVLDCRRTVRTIVASVRRRRIGDQRVTWTGSGGLREPEQARAMMVALQIVLADVERYA